jgi:hypothetical protein
MRGRQNDDPVVAGKNRIDLSLVPFRLQFDAHSGIVTGFPVWLQLCRVRPYKNR